MNVDALVKQIEELTLEQREDLSERLDLLYGSSDEPVELSEGMKTLLDERLADADANPGVGYTWDEVVAFVKRKK